MKEQIPKTAEEKIDHLLFRVQALESHLINNIVKLQQQFTPDPDVHNLITQLNDYTRHIVQMHESACHAYGKMNDLADRFRKECAPYGEIKFLNKRLHEIQESLKSMQESKECAKNSRASFSWIEELSLELKKIKPELKEVKMDKQIKKIQKDTRKLEKEEAALLKADKKRDKIVEVGKKAMKEKENT
jgi:hypothetical protein